VASEWDYVIKLRIVKVTKMGIDEWTKEVMSHLNARYYKINSISAFVGGFVTYPCCSRPARGVTSWDTTAISSAGHTSRWPRTTWICHKAAHKCRYRNCQERR
jgi:hypothetical protein